MLYLVKLDSVYKIGYSQDVIQRLNQFRPTHIDVELISTKEGTKKDEKELHKLCKNYHIKNELFHQKDEVIKIFNDYIIEQQIMDSQEINETTNFDKSKLEFSETIEYGYSLLSEEEESVIMNLSVKTIRRINKGLIEKGYLEIIEIDGKRIKRFNITKLNTNGQTTRS